jgi:hypothetical protein
MTEETPARSAAGVVDAVPEETLRAWIETRLRAAPIRTEPFRHLVVDEIFPPRYFDTLAAAWPPTDAFKRDRHGRKFDLVPQVAVDSADGRAGGYASLPPRLRATWDHFVFTVNRTIVGPVLRELFAEEIDRRIALMRRAHAEGRISYSMGRTDTWQPAANVGRFMMRGPGYELRPHVDSMPYVLTVLHYFPDADDRADGTVLYKADAPLDFDSCVTSGSTEYFDQAGITCREVARLPFSRNTLLAFPNALDAAHGAVAPPSGLRRLFQYHLSLKSDDEKV